MADPNQHQRLAQFALRAQQDSFFLGYYLLAYAAQHALSPSDVATHLGCSTDRFRKLTLCRAPNPAASRFHDDVVRVAEFAGCDAGRLGQVLREVAVLDTMRDSVAGQQEMIGATLLAARDKKGKGSSRSQSRRGGKRK